jgi:hypothetical protein
MGICLMGYAQEVELPRTTGWAHRLPMISGLAIATTGSRQGLATHREDQGKAQSAQTATRDLNYPVKPL